MAIVLQLPLCLYELQGPVVSVDDCFLPQNVMLALPTSLHNGIHLLIIGGVFLNCFGKCRTMIDHHIPLLGDKCTDRIVRGFCLNFKWLLIVW